MTDATHEPRDQDDLAARILEAARVWREARLSGTAREPDRPRVTYPSGHERPVGNLTMAIVETLAFLGERGFAIAEIRSDYNEDAVVWIGPGEMFLEVGVSSGWVVMVGPTVDGQIPRWEAGLHRHARDVVAPTVAATLPTLELDPGCTDVTTRLPACAAWARAALDSVDAFPS